MLKNLLKTGVLGISTGTIYYYGNDISTKALNLLDPETAHNISIKALSKGIMFYNDPITDKKLETKVFGLDFKNPVGLAAGFDKNAEAYNNLFKLGFGHVEVGTITYLEQKGNPKPRIFRYKDKIVNHCGLNNHGTLEVRDRIIDNIDIPYDTQLLCDNIDKLYALERSKSCNVLGISIAPNNNTQNPILDYCNILSNIRNYGDYFVINISCPNVKHKKYDFDKTIGYIRQFCTKPLLVKLSPDLEDSEYINLSKLFLKNNIDGIILTNTIKIKEGGESGSTKLYEKSNQVLSLLYRELDGKIPIIGCGGILTGEQAYEKICLGASLIQIYSGFVLKGPKIINEINQYLLDRIQEEKVESITELVGKYHK